MQNYSKAIGAAVGTVAGGGLAGSLPFVLPDGSPWYAYIIGYTIAGLLPIVATFLAPANKP